MATTTVTLFDKYQNITLTANPILIRPGETSLFGWNIVNPGATAAYVVLFDAVQVGDVTLGVTVPDYWVYLPAGTPSIYTPDKEAAKFKTGLVIAATGGLVSALPPVSDQQTIIQYK